MVPCTVFPLRCGTLHSEGVIVTESHNSPSILMEALRAPNRAQVVARA